jgi:hypothetical protein
VLFPSIDPQVVVCHTADTVIAAGLVRGELLFLFYPWSPFHIHKISTSLDAQRLEPKQPSLDLRRCSHNLLIHWFLAHDITNHVSST